MLFKKSVRTSKRTPHFTITNINWLTLFKEIIPVYSENRMTTQPSRNEPVEFTEVCSMWLLRDGWTDGRDPQHYASRTMRPSG